MKSIARALAAVIVLASLVIAAWPYVLVLGIAEDAGVPQIGCDSPFCRRATAGCVKRSRRSRLVDPGSKQRWVFDATPDFPKQFELLKTASSDRSNVLSGIFLTHAHVGHYTGLMYLGRESMNSRDVPVFAMPRMKQMLEQNAPWSQLVGLHNISLKPLADSTQVRLNDRLTVEPFLVPHRDEFSETVGFRIRSGSKTLAFIPDIDKWEKWKTGLADLVRASDYLLLDGTFYADGEIARPMSEVPHPFVSETMALLASLPSRERAKVHFIHFNHSNPLVQGDRKKLAAVRARGFHVAATGLRLGL